VTNQKAPIFRRSRAGLRFIAGLALAAAGQPVPSFATVPVDLELVLAVDVSGSMDREEAEMQRAGYVSALVDPKVLRAIRSGYHGRIAATYVEWSGWDYNEVITDWRLLDNEESVRAFSDVIAAAPLTRGRYTSISGAIEFSLPLFDENAYEGKRRVIDVSGDGPPTTRAAWSSWRGTRRLLRGSPSTAFPSSMTESIPSAGHNCRISTSTTKAALSAGRGLSWSLPKAFTRSPPRSAKNS
jgi:hypothetical protein